MAYAVLMSCWLTSALEEEVADGLMTPGQAVDATTRLLRGNQLACFDSEGRRRALRDAPSTHEFLPWPYRNDDDPATDRARAVAEP